MSVYSVCDACEVCGVHVACVCGMHGVVRVLSEPESDRACMRTCGCMGRYLHGCMRVSLLVHY